MISLKKKINNRYILFLSISILLFFFVFVIIQSQIHAQENNAILISKSSKQRILSRHILKIISRNNASNLTPSLQTIDTLQLLTKEFNFSHSFLYNQYITTSRSKKLDSLYSKLDNDIAVITKISNNFTTKNSIGVDTINKFNFEKTELSFLNSMDIIVNEYQKIAESKLEKTKHSFYLLSLVSIIVFAGGFYYLLLPIIKNLIKKGVDLGINYKALQASQEAIRHNLLELKQLKLNLELKDKYNHIFIEQAAPSLAMLDKNMVYMAVSEKWKKDYKMENLDVIGKSHYEIFPEIGDDWKQKHQKCLKGETDSCDEFPFVRKDGSIQWIFWDVRPWYLDDNEIGGLLMHTGDITKQKTQDFEKERIESILKNTNEVAKIGTWELDIKTDLLTFSPMSKQLLKLDNDEKIYGNSSLYLYKEGISRDKIVNAIGTLIKTGEPFDIELEIITKDDSNIWVRDIGQAEFVNGKCIRAYGLVQDITSIKLAEQELVKQNQLLSFSEKINKIGNWQWDFKTNQVIFSPGLYRILGLEQNDDKITIEKFTGYVHPEDADNLQTHVKNTIQNKKFDGDLVHRIIAEDGSIKIIQVVGKVFTDENNEISSVIGSFQDITSRKVAEHKFKGLLESAPDAVIILNENMNIHLINNQAEKMFGYSVSELIDKNPKMLIPKNFREDFAKYMEAYFLNPLALKMGESREVIGINKKGEQFPVQISLSPLQTEDGILISAAIRDVTVQKQAAQKIINANNNLELLAKELTTQNAQLADFAHITSHNLRAPVSNLNSLIDIYNMSSDGEEKHIIFEKFEKVINHLTVTLNTLVDALKIKNHVAIKEEVVFSKTLKKTKELLAAQIIETQAVITSNFTAIDNTRYNKIYFESIFLNLVENAIKYKAKDRAPKIHIKTEFENGKICLKISDNGLGIDLKKHGLKLFGLNKVFHRHPDAKGVGLFMTKLHVQSMGGNITAISKVNEGTTFIINFN